MKATTTPGFLLDGRQTKGTYHRWTGADTACRMWSTGGLQQSKPSWLFVSAPPPVREMCHLCRRVGQGEVKVSQPQGSALEAA